MLSGTLCAPVNLTGAQSVPGTSPKAIPLTKGTVPSYLAASLRAPLGDTLEYIFSETRERLDFEWTPPKKSAASRRLQYTVRRAETAICRSPPTFWCLDQVLISAHCVGNGRQPTSILEMVVNSECIV